MVLKDHQLAYGNYLLERHVATTQLAEIFLARHRLLRNRAALITVIHPSLLSSDDAVERFLFEAETAEGLKHPRLVRVFEFGYDLDRYWIATEHVAG
ncbi:MAG: hypothetical protein NZ518_05870, partial [Dehalococcoidia bacterium]|nr:hypothetical protein [Dehalococcoidia bacterium]